MKSLLDVKDPIETPVALYCRCAMNANPDDVYCLQCACLWRVHAVVGEPEPVLPQSMGRTLSSQSLGGSSRYVSLITRPCG